MRLIFAALALLSFATPAHADDLDTVLRDLGFKPMTPDPGERERIWGLVDIISTGQMPAGYSAEDLRAMGLPLPGELYREEQPDGTILIRQVAPSELAKKAARKNDFVCDSPDSE